MSIECTQNKIGFPGSQILGSGSSSVCYLLNQYPKISHTFIRQEIKSLETLGLSVIRISLRGWDEQVKDVVDEKERANTRYILKPPFLNRSIYRFMEALLFNTSGLISAARQARITARSSARPFYTRLIYLIEACTLVSWLKKTDASHIHAHFGTNAAEVAMLAHFLSGFAYSFTVHGPEEFDNPLEFALSQKARNAKFIATVSSFGRGQLYRWLDRADWEKIKIVRCGLSELELQQPHVKIDHSNVFLCIARLSEQKGLLVLLEACALLKSQVVLLS